MPSILLCRNKSVCAPSVLFAHLNFFNVCAGKRCKPFEEYRTKFADFKASVSERKAQSATWTRSGAAATGVLADGTAPTLRWTPRPRPKAGIGAQSILARQLSICYYNKSIYYIFILMLFMIIIIQIAQRIQVVPGAGLEPA